MSINENHEKMFILMAFGAYDTISEYNNNEDFSIEYPFINDSYKIKYDSLSSIKLRFSIKLLDRLLHALDNREDFKFKEDYFTIGIRLRARIELFDLVFNKICPLILEKNQDFLIKEKEIIARIKQLPTLLANYGKELIKYNSNIAYNDPIIAMKFESEDYKFHVNYGSGFGKLLLCVKDYYYSLSAEFNINAKVTHDKFYENKYSISALQYLLNIGIISNSSLELRKNYIINDPITPKFINDIKIVFNSMSEMISSNNYNESTYDAIYPEKFNELKELKDRAGSLFDKLFISYFQSYPTVALHQVQIRQFLVTGDINSIEMFRGL